MNINYQRFSQTEEFITAKISDNALKQTSRTPSVLPSVSAQFTTANWVNVSTNSSRSECMQLGWRTPRVDSLKLENYTRIGNAHKERKKIFVFYCVAVICTTPGKQQMRACVRCYDQYAVTASLCRSSKRSTYCKHTVLVSDCVSTRNETGN